MEDLTQEQNASLTYRRSQIMTAGKVKSIQMLLRHLKNKLNQIDMNNPDENLEKDLLNCRNIVAQLEMALNFRQGTASQDIFDLYELIYMALEQPTKKSIKTARYLTENFLVTMTMVFPSVRF